MKLYNTLTRNKEVFVPLKPGKVGFYICGPTVYNDIHIGNARTFLSFDVIRRYLEYSGFEVTYVQNITDVDDKIINRAAEEGRSAAEVAAKYTQAFIDAMQALGVEDPTIRPKATEEISSMIELIECLVHDEHAYTAEGDVYFSVRSFESYGQLSGRNVDDLMAGARVEVDERKRDPLDFALWKAAKPGEPSWPSPWGEGRPGWHIECSAMSERYLGIPFDIHAGGEDLIFPHHENELAQSEACCNRGFARYWLHGGMLTIDKEKMSKSEGNYLLLKDVLEHVRPQALRLLMLQTHYRSPFDYSPERLDEAAAALERIEGALGNIAWALDALGEGYPHPGDVPSGVSPESHPHPGDVPSGASPSQQENLLIANAFTRFCEYMDDDFNTAGAIAVVFDLVSEANLLLAQGVEVPGNAAALNDLSKAITRLLAVLGIVPKTGPGHEELIAKGDQPRLLTLASALAGYEGTETDQALESLLGARAQARKDKDWSRADEVRNGLADLGLVVEDTPQGQRVVRG